MASELRVNTLKDASGNNSVALSTVAQGSLKGFAFYQQSTDTLDNTFNIASATDNSTGEAYLNLTNNVADADEPHTGSGVGSANTTVIGYEANSDSTTSSRRYNTTNSAAGDALSDASTYTLIGGDLA